MYFGRGFVRKTIISGGNHIEQLKIIFTVLGKPEYGDDEWITTKEAKQWVRSLKPMRGKDFSKIFTSASPLALDLLKKMLICNPKNRLSISQGLAHPWFEELHREEDEPTCNTPFNLDFEFEQKITTEFGIRHMMWQELKECHEEISRKSGLRYKPKKKKKKRQTKTPMPASNTQKVEATFSGEAPF